MKRSLSELSNEYFLFPFLNYSYKDEDDISYINGGRYTKKTINHENCVQPDSFSNMHDRSLDLLNTKEYITKENLSSEIKKDLHRFRGNGIYLLDNKKHLNNFNNLIITIIKSIMDKLNIYYDNISVDIVNYDIRTKETCNSAYHKRLNKFVNKTLDLDEFSTRFSPNFHIIVNYDIDQQALDLGEFTDLIKLEEYRYILIPKKNLYKYLLNYCNDSESTRLLNNFYSSMERFNKSNYKSYLYKKSLLLEDVYFAPNDKNISYSIKDVKSLTDYVQFEIFYTEYLKKEKSFKPHKVIDYFLTNAILASNNSVLEILCIPRQIILLGSDLEMYTSISYNLKKYFFEKNISN